nr:putative ubiquitin family protein [Tanacetum cinerariifolium]
MKNNSGTGEEEKKVEINIRRIGPSPPSSLHLISPIKVRDLRNLIAANGRFPLDNLKLVFQGNVLHDTKYGDQVSLHFNNGDTLIVAVKPKPPAKHIQNDFEEDEDELKVQLPELNSLWKKRFFILLHDKFKIPDMLLMAIFSISLKVWAVIIMWFIFAPIAHKWGVGPLYILGTGFAIIFLNLGKRQQGDMSAYSIFNEDFRELPGTFNAERVDRDIRAEPEEAPSESEELQSLGSIVPFMGEKFEVVEPSGTRTDSVHSSASSDSTAPLSPDHPLTHISPTPTPTRASFNRKTTRMAVRAQPAMSTGLSASVPEAMTLSDSAFCKSEGDELGYEDIKEDESLDADDEGERSDDEGHGSDDESRGLGDKDHRLDDEAVSVMDTTASKPLGLGYRAARRRTLKSIKEIAPSTYEVGQSSRSMAEQHGADKVSAFRQPTLTTWVDPKDDRVYTDIPVYPPIAPVQTPLSPEWSSGSFHVSPSSPVVPSHIASPVATPTATISIDEGQFLEVGAQLELHGSILHDHTQRLDALPPTLFADIDRDVRELYTRSRVAGHVDTRMVDMSRAGYDDHRLIYDLLVQQVALQRELHETRDRITDLEYERDRKEQ